MGWMEGWEERVGRAELLVFGAVQFPWIRFLLLKCTFIVLRRQHPLINIEIPALICAAVAV